MTPSKIEFYNLPEKCNQKGEVASKHSVDMETSERGKNSFHLRPGEIGHKKTDQFRLPAFFTYSFSNPQKNFTVILNL